ncbi:hypothetical protein [Rhizobium sp. PL01]|uniref:hypothetical protein n=1 Tax=Rhizobium sp. PL01 TaxID=3085631 RepID=UPI002980DC74|nr:hypothetical protein [Rhizobium sp. PL01]MDW5313668.1 hypothetical protein [Rhizobium sp. PL01]
MTNDKVRLSAVVTLDQMDFLDERAARLQCSRSAVLRTAVVLAMAAKRKQAEMAAAEVDQDG